ncbi:MAG TPA: phosphatase PAP2 family protein [Actinomycetes bacterium]|nr:phosphatase PAP2 family protein [Actinomycetes bacterium]
MARIARAAGIIAVLLALDYALLVLIGWFLTKVLGEDSSLIKWEDGVNTGLADGRTPRMDDATYLMSGLGNTGAIIGALLVVSIGLLVATRKWGPSLFLVVAVSGQALVFLLVTLTISRQRPDVKRLDDSPPTSSFPSGHTGAATALFVASAFLVLWYVRNKLVKVIGVVLLLAVPLLVAYGRLYRGMHHPSDIMGAYINGLACIAIAAGVILAKGPLARFAPDGGAEDPRGAADRARPTATIAR